MAVEIQHCEAPISPDQIVLVEQKLKIKLPDRYRKFLLSHNGGRPNPSRFSFRKQDDAHSSSCVDWFLAIYDGEHDNFVSYFITYKVHQVRLPGELIPIAHDPGGNLICIAVDGGDRGAVYFWDHENEADRGEAPSYDNVRMIADGFDGFLDNLTNSP